MPVQPIPEGHQTVSPYLVVRGADDFITFVTQAFAAEQTMRIAKPDGTVMHAEVRIGDSIVMLGDASDDYPPMPVMLHLYLPDMDAAYHAALAAGAESLREPADQPDGDRRGGVKDRWDNQWWLATHVEDLTPDEMQRRQAAAPA